MFATLLSRGVSLLVRDRSRCSLDRSIAPSMLSLVPPGPSLLGARVSRSSTPMLTMAGSKMATRVALSLLKAAGAQELIADSFEQYEEMAVSLATDPDRLFEVSTVRSGSIRITRRVASHGCRIRCEEPCARGRHVGLSALESLLCGGHVGRSALVDEPPPLDLLRPLSCPWEQNIHLPPVSLDPSWPLSTPGLIAHHLKARDRVVETEAPRSSLFRPPPPPPSSLLCLVRPEVFF